MRKKTKVVLVIFGYLAVNSWMRKDLEIVRLKKENEKLIEANHYLFDVARSAVRRLPIGDLPKMINDVEFYHIASKER